MNVARQDAWSEDEDILLAEVVLRHIREGGTQLAAFEEVGTRLSRTAAACGFRWNSTVRKQFESAITLAKEQRKSARKKEANHLKQKVVNNSGTQTFDLSKIIISLQSLQQRLESDEGSRERKENELTKRLQEVEWERDQLKEKFERIEQDYQVMLSIMERARKMTVFQEEEKNQVRFQMDENGNLERVKK
ncbi:RsfA family transcriptional regulator [Bacillus solimangrovi]|uniref:Uncharacterized protein n=1 Tax=Bacillus solimangrovi TaxID=1305675 RepID=A0A1E5LIM5_9BACI|nr:RsfA family transcriptional regulator [Bacillus solimangrovi]OEH93939.1 hypothetical protein BFG57_10760 [Bacillus solimangrovi]